MVIINPPFKLDVDLAALALGLGESVPGRCRLRWTVPE
jgi:23S rRNA A2030 N6-methylase RlmJ